MGKENSEKLNDLIKYIVSGMLKENLFTSILTGTVKSTNPLVITTIEKDIVEKYLILSSTCKKKEIDNTHYHIYQDHDKNDGESSSGGEPQVDAHTSNEVPNSYTYKGHTISNPPKIILWDDLQIGEKVLLLKLNKGQKYWVLDREGSQNGV